MIRIIPFLVALYFTTAQEFPTDICELPQDIGKCRKYVTKYFFNKTDNSCQTFGWGGCGGNANKFDTVDECESFCKNGTSPKQLRSARKSTDEAPKEVFIGTVLDVNEIETEIINFESGFGNWSSQSLKIVNLSDSSANTDAINVKVGELVLVPTVSLVGGNDSELSNSFNIAAESLLEIDFGLYVSGYNSTLVGGVESKYNPSFGVIVEDESSSKRSTVLELDRLHVPENAWNKFRFTIKNEEEKKLKIIFSMSLGLGAGNVIALDDVEIRWIPMLESEADTIHKNILFSNVSSLISEQDSNVVFHEPNNSTENTTEIVTTPSTTTQGLFGDLTIETINKTSSENTNKTVIETAKVDGNKTSTNNFTYNVTESPLISNNTGINETTTAYTENPNIFGPFNTTTEQSKNESSINQEEIAGQNNTGNSNSTNIVFPQNTTENTNSSNIVFPENNNQTQNSSQPSNSTTETNPELVPQNQTTKDDKVPQETTVKAPENVNANKTETTTDKAKIPESGNTTLAPIEGTTYNVSNSSAIKSEEPDNGTQYDYTAEVVLICLVVIFGLLFLLMVVKYYRLRTSIGDYQIQQGARQTYDNPAFNGFGMQDSYQSR